MSRGSQGSQSSLDLFLDTICNTFGGIMFLSILLSVLVQMRSKSNFDSRPDNSVSVTSMEYEEIIAKLQSASEERSQLKSLIKPPPIEPAPQEDAELNSVQMELEATRKKLDLAILEQQSAATTLASQLKSNALIKEEIENLKKGLIESQAALEVESKALEKALDDQTETLKLPEVKNTNKRNLVILMRFGKVYFLTNDFTSAPNDQDISITQQSGGVFSASPKRNRGYKLPESQSTVEQSMKRNSPDISVYTVIVWPDSFAEFGELKKLLIRAGFQYDLQPIIDLPACSFSRGASTPRVQ